MSDLRAELMGIQSRHASDCDRIVQAARKAGLPVGYGACGNGGIPTFQAIVQRCVQAMETHAAVVAERDRLAKDLAEALGLIYQRLSRDTEACRNKQRAFLTRIAQEKKP